jgi:FlaA1/EpsC-like NDP-sugar epimerase
MRNKIKYFLVFLDIIAISFALIVSYFVFFGINEASVKNLVFYWWFLPLSVAIYVGNFRNFGLYQWVWSYISLRELIAVAKAVTLSSFLLGAFLFITFRFVTFRGNYFLFPVLILNWLLTLFLIGSIRLSIRVIKETLFKSSHFDGDNKKKNILIVGAGDAGEITAREMLKLSYLGYNPVAFVDDNPVKLGQYIHQLPVVGNVQEIPEVVKQYNVDYIVIAIPSASGIIIRKIVEKCEQSGVKFKIVPGLYELIDGTVNVNQIREVQIEDLLGREQVKVNLEEIASYLTGARVLITGAGGSIGSELCRQVSIFKPAELILLGHGENSIYFIHKELERKFPYLTFHEVIADIKNISQIETVFKRFSPTVVFHAAAHKHVHLMEKNPEEAVMNNIIGTKILVDAAAQNHVLRFVFVSTDKAVNPSSIMGATKKVAETLVQMKAKQSNATQFVAVRFGNVLDSRGSVIPVFKKQIAEGGPVTVTHPEVMRYFMTIPEAVQLIIQAGSMGEGGEIFVLDMGQPVKIIDLAKDLIRLSGFEEGKDIEIRFTGLRPGEKLFEEISTKGEDVKLTKHKKIFMVRSNDLNFPAFEDNINKLEQFAIQGNSLELVNKLKTLIPFYKSLDYQKINENIRIGV